MIKAVLFDLDGTLLPINTNDFMRFYLREFASYLKNEIDGKIFTKNIMDSTCVMMENKNPDLTNEKVFWNDFLKRLGKNSESIIPLMNDFYVKEFPHLVKASSPSPEKAGKIVNTVLEKGLKIALATQPVFPLIAIEHRMSWAGVENFPWKLITSYENMHFCKPTTAYYQEIAYLLGIEPNECLMVGNDIVDDLSSAKIGMKTYLAMDYFIQKDVEEIIEPDGKGSLEDFVDWFNEEIDKWD